VKIGNHFLRSRRIVRPFPADIVHRIDLLFRTRTWKYIEYLPAKMWCELIDSLSRCDCGRPVPPIRARSKNAGMAETCSSVCLHRRRGREERARQREPKEDAFALTDAIFQTGSNDD
jgi:hypothetical protein